MGLDQLGGDAAKAGGNCIEFHLFDTLVSAAVKVVGSKKSNLQFLEYQHSYNGMNVMLDLIGGTRGTIAAGLVSRQDAQKHTSRGMDRYNKILLPC